MIYTLTLNPSLDYLLDTPVFEMGKTNRSTHESLHFGGKGINVSYVLNQLGVSSVCLGFTAGFTGVELENMLKQEGLCTDFIKLEKGNTRINVKIKGGEITEVNAQGIMPSEEDIAALFEKLDSLTDGDTLILAGSTPKARDDIYSEIMQKTSQKNIRFVVDTSGKKLLDCLKYRPFLIKPNVDELSGIFGKELLTHDEIIDAAKHLQTLGAVNVLVSMGKDGAILVDENGNVHKANPIKITPVSTVGAGDSMVAGFVAGAENGYGYALKLGNACGAASACSTVLAQREEIYKLLSL